MCDARPDGTGYALTDPEPLRWWTTATVRNQPYLLPDPGQTPRGPGDYRRWPSGDLRDDIAVCAELAHARGPQATRRYVVAEEGARLVGYAGLAAAGGIGDVQTIGVARDHWGGGLGARLLTDLLRHAMVGVVDTVEVPETVENDSAEAPKAPESE